MIRPFPTEELLPDETYYCVTLSGDEDGKTWSCSQTRWAGFDNSDPRIELRRLSEVLVPRFAEMFIELGQPFVVVNDTESFVRWFLGGGHAIISKAMVQKHVFWESGVQRCVCEGRGGFTSVDSLPKSAFKKAPTPKLRMEVIKRDRYRCIICGRRPDDYTDIELHVHHIRPFAQRGVTTKPNLITLCCTCHKGLDPHFESSLYELAFPILARSPGESIDGNYMKSVGLYRKLIAEDIAKATSIRRGAVDNRSGRPKSKF